MTQTKNYMVLAQINASGLVELKNLSETLAKQCEQVSETIEKISKSYFLNR